MNQELGLGPLPCVQPGRAGSAASEAAPRDQSQMTVTAAGDRSQSEVRREALCQVIPVDLQHAFTLAGAGEITLLMQFAISARGSVGGS